MFARRFVPPLWLGMVLAAAPGVAHAEESYRLGAMDVLNLRVSEWQTSTGTLRDWSAVSGEYTVGANGNVSIPFVGEVRAADRSTADLSGVIADGLQTRLALADRPDASVEIATYRPVYIVGEVQSPGAQPYAPGLSVIKAVSVSGGLRRAAEVGARVERDVVRSRGELDVLAAESVRLTLRRARLEAELAGRGTLNLPEELAEVEGVGPMLADEQAIIAANVRRVELQRSSLNDLKVLLASEVEALAGKRANMERQIELTEEELGNVGSLVQRGLVVNARVSDLERRLAEFQSQLLDIDTAALRARQDISRADQDLIRLENDRASELAEAKRTTDAELEANGPARLTQRALLAEALLFAPMAETAGELSSYSYTIQRVVNGETAEFAATEATPVQPGDVVKVAYTLPAVGGF